MGSGIAAHLANVGFNVSLLDLTRDSVNDAFGRAKIARPPHFFVPDTASKIRLGSINENLSWVREADWVCEAVVEKIDIKRQLFAQIEPLLNPETMITTNTSGLQIELLAEGRSDAFKRKFLGTHFFNPPRYLKLLELIPTASTAPEVIDQMTEFLEDLVERRVVVAKDTPGFIANRYGMWCMYQAIHTAEMLHLSIEEVDAITGPFLGRPRSGSFRLNDIVGLDIMADIAQNLVNRCPEDPFMDNFETPGSMEFLAGKGWIGEKAGQGYTRRQGRELLSFDLRTHAYRQRIEAQLPSLQTLGKLPLGERLRQALELRDQVGEYLRNHLIPILKYAVYLKEEISHNVEDFDRVMKWGFGWEAGPFEMIDAIGAKHLDIKEEPFYQGTELRSFSGAWEPKRVEEKYRPLSDYPVVEKKENFTVRDLGDGVFSLGTTTKMGAITPALVRELTTYLGLHKERYVFTSESKVFSVGFDLNFFVDRIQVADPQGIEAGLAELHHLGELMEQRRIVSAVWGHCLGAGLELALSTSQIVAAAETNLGLPEALVGLIPGGRGTVLMRLYNQEPKDGVTSINRLATTALDLTQGLTGNPDFARHHGLLRDQDVIEYHPDRLLYTAKQLALQAQPVTLPGWRLPAGPMTGVIDRGQQDLIKKGTLTEYDEVIGDKIKLVFSKANSYEDAKNKEIRCFLELCFNALTLARIKHMLETGKPLRN